MIRLCLYPVLWLVNCLIALLAALGIGLEWGAGRLVPLQKFLSKKIERGAR